MRSPEPSKETAKTSAAAPQVFPFWRQILLLVLDSVAVLLAHFLSAFVLEGLDLAEMWTYLQVTLPVLPYMLVVTLLLFFLFRLYNSVWSFAGFNELISVLAACLLSVAVQVALLAILSRPLNTAYHVLFLFFLIFLVAAVRFSYRLIRRIRHFSRKNQQPKVPVMIVGAGEAGASLIREIDSSEKTAYAVACLIDDNRYKRGKYIAGHKIVGDRRDILTMAEKFAVQEIFVAIPSASQKNIRDILEICKLTSCKLKLLPGLHHFLHEEVSIAKLREVEIEDLLGREPIRVNPDEIGEYLKDKTVLVTGGGGSIGSELCRQIAAQGPRQLIIFDIYENNAYEIQLELQRDYPDLDLVTLIGSVRDEARVNKLFDTYRPAIVYHAAAHKHVPLMEDSPNEAVKNNVFGTYNVAQAAGHYGAKRFVMISTDKAVNPTNVMGASKRMCEMIVQMQDKQFPKTEFVAVRFGNVLGSNGSVVPLFRRQIEKGGPVTVTHPDIIRYFMTIPEAVSLVLQAGAYAKGGEIFVLDMGEPIKIDKLARSLIQLSGYIPDVDIKIEYTGLRPGEKLYEEMLMREEGMRETANHLIHIGKPIEFDIQQLKEGLTRLKACVEEEKPIIALIEELVPTYTYTPNTK